MPCPFQHRIIEHGYDLEDYMLTEQLIAFGLATDHLQQRLGTPQWCTRWKKAEGILPRIALLA